MDQSPEIKIMLEKKLSQIAKKWEEERLTWEEMFKELTRENGELKKEFLSISRETEEEKSGLGNKLRSALEEIEELKTEKHEISEKLARRRKENEMMEESQTKEIDVIRKKLEEKLSGLARSMAGEQKDWEEKLTIAQVENRELKEKLDIKNQEIVSAAKKTEYKGLGTHSRMDQTFRELEMSVEREIDEFRRKMEMNSLRRMEVWKADRDREYELWKIRRKKT